MKYETSLWMWNYITLFLHTCFLNLKLTPPGSLPLNFHILSGDFHLRNWSLRIFFFFPNNINQEQSWKHLKYFCTLGGQLLFNLSLLVPFKTDCKITSYCQKFIRLLWITTRLATGNLVTWKFFGSDFNHEDHVLSFLISADDNFISIFYLLTKHMMF